MFLIRELTLMSDKFILTADWHLRSNKPRCRLDEDWLDTQRNVLNQIYVYAKKHKANVFVVGDIFHSTNETTNEIIAMVQNFAYGLAEFNRSLYILAGNHDLPQHNLDNIGRSAFQILLGSVNIFHMRLRVWEGDESMTISAVDFSEENSQEARLLFKHILCFPEKAWVPPGAKVTKPSELFAQYGNAQYIFTGDYHQSFSYKKGNKKLFNPGCIIRQAADLINYEPSVMLILNDNGELLAERLPIEDPANLVTDEYLEREEERNTRIDAFIERIKENGEITFDFLENVHNALKGNKIDPNVKAFILKLLEE